MSDFDKEAERERLREKYERDEAKREVTERMSELLLKGATMTNAHCERCGDPIFRYDGQEFCATCERAVERPTEGDEGADEDGEELEVATPSEGARVQFGGEDAADSPDEPPADPAPSPPADAEPPADATPDHSRGEAAARGQTDAQPAEAELERSVAHLARLARTADDAGQAKALLAAAREGAEALAALRGD